MNRYRYLHLDVFTSNLFEGNQLAVFPEPADLTTGQMQQIAKEMAFSETTFIFPPEAGGGVRMRIFTPGSELPFAGHPTIGSTFALVEEGVIAPGRQEFVFELGIGPTPVSLEWTPEGRLASAWMTQPLPEFGGSVEDRRAFAEAVGVETGDLLDLPVQVVSCGLPYLIAALASRAAIDRVSIERRALLRCCRAAGIDDVPVFVFTTDRSGGGQETVYSRMLAPGFGIAEDPATGSASGPLGCYLLHHRVVSADQARQLLSLQGVAMGRPSWIHISIDSRDGTISAVRVGGTAVLVGTGELRMED